MPTVTVTERPTWISYAEAMRLAAIGKPALLALIEQGRLSVRSIPGSRPRIRLDELEALIRESTRAARAATQTGEAVPC